MVEYVLIKLQVPFWFASNIFLARFSSAFSISFCLQLGQKGADKDWRLHWQKQAQAWSVFCSIHRLDKWVCRRSFNVSNSMWQKDSTSPKKENNGFTQRGFSSTLSKAEKVEEVTHSRMRMTKGGFFLQVVFFREVCIYLLFSPCNVFTFVIG